ncbi:MAG: hypothetical protein AB7F35_17540, partial [Acetobacteraceae bacterium]
EEDGAAHDVGSFVWSAEPRWSGALSMTRPYRPAPAPAVERATLSDFVDNRSVIGAVGVTSIGAGTDRIVADTKRRYKC